MDEYQEVIQALKAKEFYGIIDKLERGLITIECAKGSVNGTWKPELPKPIEINPYNVASEFKSQGVDRKTSWSRWIQRTSLRPGMDAKDWFAIYDSV